MRRSLAGMAASAAMVFGLAVQAAPMPASGTVSPTNASTPQVFTGSFAVDNPAGVCQPQICDDFSLTLDLPANYAATNPSAKLSITLAGANGSDFDLQLRQGTTVVASEANAGDEVIEVAAGQGTQTFVVRVIPFQTLGEKYTATITLKTGAGSSSSSSSSSGGSASSSSGGSGSSGGSSSSGGVVDPKAPRFHVYLPPAGAASSFGEPSIGYNQRLKHAMFIGGSDPTYKITFPDRSDVNKPQACDANWEDVTFAYTDGNTPPTLDPILYTDVGTGRTFVSQLLGPTSRFAFTDDDGANWTPGQFGAPNGATDHQTVGSGPYPVGTTVPHPTSSIAVYYCSQQQYATCNRSDDGGLTFGPGVFAYNGVLDGCANFHGHIKVSPDGTVYLPNAGCGATQALSVSEDVGQSYQIRSVTPSTEVAGSFDPSVAIGAKNTVYFCRTDKDGHIRIAVSKDHGRTWGKDFDVGASFGLQNGAFPEAVAGDDDRASCAFLGTTEPGNYEAADYKGVWYGYMATTYDGGTTWTTVNITPNDPVQGAGGICISGTGCTGNNRNLLDFNEIALDEKGRPVFGYADGCTGACVGNPITANNFSAEGRVIRQTGGKTLYAAFDNEVRNKPDGACLAGFRDAIASTLSWAKPADIGEAEIATYSVYRGTTPDNLTLLASNLDRASYVDPAGSSVAQYYYAVTAFNSLGEGLFSNRLPLSVGVAPVLETACKLPGLTVVVDPVGDENAVTPQVDIVKISVGEPESFAGKVVITLRVGSLSPLPPNQLYAVRLKFGTPPGGAEDYWVGMNTAGGTAQFQYGTTAVTSGPTVPVAGSAGARVFTPLGTLDAQSAFTAAGEIALVVPLNRIGNPGPGSLISGITGSVRASSNANAPTAGNAVETTGDGSYTLRAVDGCFVNTLPTARLLANKLTGDAPLVVAFDASTSSDSDAGDRITSYSFGFGDGTPGITQATPTLSHTYTEPGIYTAVVMVTDAHSGSAIASQRIEVLKAVQSLAPFSFVERTNVPLNYFITSEPVTLSGFTGQLDIGVGEGMQYSLNGGAFTNAAGKVNPGDKLVVRHLSANAINTSKTTSIFVGGNTAVLKTTTTTTEDRIPDAFDFGLNSGQTAGVLSTSGAITLKGYTHAAAIAAGPDAEYSINNGAFTRAAGVLQVGDTLRARHTASSQTKGYTKTYIKVGGVVGYYTSRTK